ncbi:DUF732 domain-containing protein [Nocardia vinacea]|uniref:DUF732 domain-containing protein n=1 Tax=Nocardia vinacea TaxID=96468 RepID=UPI0033ECD7C1
MRIPVAVMVSFAAAALASCSSSDEAKPQNTPVPVATVATVPTTTSASKPGARPEFVLDNPIAAGNFLASLQERRAQILRRDPNMAVAVGGEICDDLDRGMTYSQVVQKWTRTYTEADTLAYAQGAVRFLCQDNIQKVPA